MKEGRTFVTNGPMLLLRVNGKLPGSELTPEKHHALRVEARAWAPSIIGSPKLLEVVSNGKVIKSVDLRDPDRSELKTSFDIPANLSMWIAARVTSENGAVAHTSPVYVLPNGERFWNRPDLPSLVDARLRKLNALREELRSAKYGFSLEDRQSLEARIEGARNACQGLLQGTGSITTRLH
jgi:hypothetical protein